MVSPLQTEKAQLVINTSSPPPNLKLNSRSTLVSVNDIILITMIINSFFSLSFLAPIQSIAPDHSYTSSQWLPYKVLDRSAAALHGLFQRPLRDLLLSSASRHLFPNHGVPFPGHLLSCTYGHCLSFTIFCVVFTGLP